MSFLDAFFSIGPPIIIGSLLITTFAVSVARSRGVYEGEEGEKRRDAVNAKYRTTIGAVVIGGIFVMLWGVTVASLIEEWGAIFFTYVVAALLIIPFLAVCAAVIALYMFAVHGYAKTKEG